MQRLEVSKEDLTQATNKLGLTGPPKSKTIQVMEECGKDTLDVSHIGPGGQISLIVVKCSLCGSEVLWCFS